MLVPAGAALRQARGPLPGALRKRACPGGRPAWRGSGNHGDVSRRPGGRGGRPRAMPLHRLLLLPPLRVVALLRLLPLAPLRRARRPHAGAGQRGAPNRSLRR